MYQTFQTIFENEDSHMKTYFLMDSPLPVTLILLFYLIFVLKVGPSLMKNREAFKLKKVIKCYNLLQMFFNGLLFLGLLLELPTKNIFCTPADTALTPDELRMARLQHSYVMNKILDLMDTIFFVLRKKDSQVSFLHVYHHILMVSCTWAYSKFYRGGQPYFLGLINTFVHFIMYYYYLLASSSSTKKNSIWWKKYLTQLQLAQHCFVASIFAAALLNGSCSFPKPVLAFAGFQAGIMIKLFSSFYMNSYNKNKIT